MLPYGGVNPMPESDIATGGATSSPAGLELCCAMARSAIACPRLVLGFDATLAAQFAINDGFVFFSNPLCVGAMQPPSLTRFALVEQELLGEEPHPPEQPPQPPEQPRLPELEAT